MPAIESAACPSPARRCSEESSVLFQASRNGCTGPLDEHRFGVNTACTVAFQSLRPVHVIIWCQLRMLNDQGVGDLTAVYECTKLGITTDNSLESSPQLSSACYVCTWPPTKYNYIVTRGRSKPKFMHASGAGRSTASKTLTWRCDV